MYESCSLCVVPRLKTSSSCYRRHDSLTQLIGCIYICLTNVMSNVFGEAVVFICPRPFNSCSPWHTYTHTHAAITRAVTRSRVVRLPVEKLFQTHVFTIYSNSPERLCLFSRKCEATVLLIDIEVVISFLCM